MPLINLEVECCGISLRVVYSLRAREEYLKNVTFEHFDDFARNTRVIALRITVCAVLDHFREGE